MASVKASVYTAAAAFSEGKQKHAYNLEIHQENPCKQLLAPVGLTASWYAAVFPDLKAM